MSEIDRGTTPTTIYLDANDTLTTGPRNLINSSLSVNNATTGSHFLLRVNIGLASFPFAQDVSPYFSPIAVAPNIPIFIDLRHINDAVRARYFGQRSITECLQHMTVTYDGTIRTIEEAPANLTIGRSGVSVGRTVSQSLLGNIPVYTRGSKVTKKRHVRFVPVKSSAKIDRPLKKTTTAFIPMRQLPRAHHQFGLVVLVCIRYLDDNDVEQSDVVPFIYNRFATAYRLDSTVSCVFPISCVRLHPVRPDEYVHTLVLDDKLKKHSYYEWLFSETKDPFSEVKDASVFRENPLYTTNGIIVPSQRHVTDRVFLKQNSHKLAPQKVRQYKFL
jgi:hypothetical protein